MGEKHIKLTYNPERADGPWFMSVGATDYPKGNGKYDKIKIDKGELGEITFKIETKDVGFSKDPIHISLAKGQPGPGRLDQFFPKIPDEDQTKPHKDTLKLTDRNWDEVPTDYYYQLNFDNGTLLDPIIQNGCCRPYPSVEGEKNMSLVAESDVLAALLLGAMVISLTALRLRYRWS